MSSYLTRCGAMARLLPALLAICLLVTLLSGCRTWKLDEHRRVVPRWPSVRILKFRTDSPNPDGTIRYDCLYVADLKGTWAHEYAGSRYDVMVFFPNGEYIGNYVDDYSSFDPLSDILQGEIGYYKVDANRLTTESYVKINFGQYGYGFFSVRQNGDLVNTGSGHIRWHQSMPYYPPLVYRPQKRDAQAEGSKQEDPPETNTLKTIQLEATTHDNE